MIIDESGFFRTHSICMSLFVSFLYMSSKLFPIIDKLKSLVLSAQMSKFVEPIIQLFANMKKEENCLRLEEIRTALAEADAERLSAGVSAPERELMEEGMRSVYVIIACKFCKTYRKPYICR